MIVNKYVIILILSVFLASVSQIVLKKSADKKYSSIIKEYLNIYVISGYGMMFIASLLTVYALSGMEYKNVPIIESVGYLFVMLLSWKFLSEKITKKKVLGIALILLGIMVFYI